MTADRSYPTAEDILNHIFAVTQPRVKTGRRHATSHFYYDPPKDWAGTLYRFAYTPWQTLDPETGKTGYWTLKYKYLKTTRQWKLVKKIRFGRRKIAKKRALEWYEKHYGRSPH